MQLADVLSRADRALGKLNGMAANLPHPQVLVAPLRRREAVLSSRIEGTRATISDLLLFEASGVERGTADDSREVSGYLDAMEEGLQALQTLPMSLRLIRGMHRTLMSFDPTGGKAPGEFRRVQNYIGSGRGGIESATYVPPPPAEMQGCLQDLERYLNTAAGTPVLVRAALMHYQFEAIHPFLDGNGRVGRLLIVLLLCAEGALAGPLLYLSDYIERTRTEYYERLLRVSTHGDWTGWIEYILRGTEASALEGVELAGKLLRLRDSYRTRLSTGRSAALTVRLAESLFVRPALTIEQAGATLGVTPRGAAVHVTRLVKAGILKESTGRQRYRVFLASEIAQLLA